MQVKKYRKRHRGALDHPKQRTSGFMSFAREKLHEAVDATMHTPGESVNGRLPTTCCLINMWWKCEKKLRDRYKNIVYFQIKMHIFEVFSFVDIMKSLEGVPTRLCRCNDPTDISERSQKLSTQLSRTTSKEIPMT